MLARYIASGAAALGVIWSLSGVAEGAQAAEAARPFPRCNNQTPSLYLGREYAMTIVPVTNNREAGSLPYSVRHGGKEAKDFYVVIFADPYLDETRTFFRLADPIFVNLGKKALRPLSILVHETSIENSDPNKFPGRQVLTSWLAENELGENDTPIKYGANGDRPYPSVYLVVYFRAEKLFEFAFDEQAERRSDEANATILRQGFDYVLAITGSGQPGDLKLLDGSRPLIRADIDKPDTSGFTLLHTFAFRGDVAGVKSLLDQGANVAAWDRERRLNALHVAASKGNDRVVNLLLEASPGTVNVTDYQGRTPLHFAAKAERGSAETVSALLAAGADAYILDQLGDTAEDYALEHTNAAAAEILSPVSPPADFLSRELQRYFSRFPLTARQTWSKQDSRPAWVKIAVTNPPIIGGKAYAGFRFKVDRAKGEDFVWAIEDTDKYHSWQIVAERGKMERGFCEYGPGLESQSGIPISTQPLAAERLLDGKTYLIWFRLIDNKPAEFNLTYTFKRLSRVPQEPDESTALGLGHHHFPSPEVASAIGVVEGNLEPPGMSLETHPVTGRLIITWVNYLGPAGRALFLKNQAILQVDDMPVIGKTPEQVMALISKQERSVIRVNDGTTQDTTRILTLKRRQFVQTIRN